MQLMIVKHLATHFHEYKALYGVRSRRSGSNIYVEILLEFDVVGEGEDCDFIVRVKLVDEVDRCILNSRQFEFCAAARIEQQGDIDRFIGCCEPGYLLLYAVFEHTEIILFQIGNSPPQFVGYDDWEGDHIDIRTDDGLLLVGGFFGFLFGR